MALPAVQTIRPGEAGWPTSLNDLGPLRPAQLHCLGDPALLLAPKGLVAIVGTRDATAYGERVADRLGEAFAAAGVPVVSGLARGIDAAAHRGALRAGGLTIAVQGPGVDVPYPAGHRALHEAIAERGMVVGEQGVGARAHAGSFPLRNRIIAALAKVVVVVEAPHKSGAMNTVEQATQLGRLVAAVPGPIDSPQSAGTNHLIGTGCHVIGTVADALSLMGVYMEASFPADDLNDEELDVLAAVPSTGAFVEEVAGASRLPLRQAGVVLTSLELKGRVWLGSDGRVSKRI